MHVIIGCGCRPHGADVPPTRPPSYEQRADERPQLPATSSRSPGRSSRRRPGLWRPLCTTRQGWPGRKRRAPPHTAAPPGPWACAPAPWRCTPRPAAPAGAMGGAGWAGGDGVWEVSCACKTSAQCSALACCASGVAVYLRGRGKDRESGRQVVGTATPAQRAATAPSLAIAVTLRACPRLTRAPQPRRGSPAWPTRM